MLALHALGKSAREIGEDLGLSHRTITLWLADAGLEPNGGHGKRKGRPAPVPDPLAVVMVGAATELASVAAGTPPTDRAGAIRHLQARLMQISTLADQLGRNVPSGATNPQALAALVRLEREQCTWIAELTPREVVDPEHDPANLSAATEVERRLMILVEATRRILRCMHCGKNPYVHA